MGIGKGADVTSKDSQQLDHWAWKLHTYGFGSFYIAFAAQVLFLLIKEWKFSSHKNHVRVMSFELVVSGILRGVILFWNPYFTSDNADKIANGFAKLSWCTATVFVASAFSILLLILLESTKITLGPSKFRKLSVLLLITAANYLLLIITRLTVTFVSSARDAVLIYTATLAFWGLAFCVGFALASVRMWRNVKFTLHSPAPGDSTFARETRRLQNLLYRTIAASVLSAMMFVLTLVATVTGFLEFASDVESLTHFWTWYAMQTALRIFELLVMIIIFETALKAKRKQNTPADKERTVHIEAYSRNTSVVPRSNAIV